MEQSFLAREFAWSSHQEGEVEEDLVPAHAHQGVEQAGLKGRIPGHPFRRDLHAVHDHTLQLTAARVRLLHGGPRR